MASRRELALKFSADATYDPTEEDVAYAIGIPLHGQRPDYIRYAIQSYFGGKREPLLDTMAHEIRQLEGADFEALVNYYSSYRAPD